MYEKSNETKMIFMKGEIINFFTSDGLQLYGFWNCVRSKVGIIYLHGMTGNFYWKDFVSLLSDIAAKNKIGLLSFGNRGAGVISKFHTRQGKGKTFGTNLERFENCIMDIDASVSFMKKRGFKKIFLVGHSTGCQKAAYYMAKKNDKRVAGIILLAPADDFNIAKRDYGSKVKKLLQLSKKMIAAGKGDDLMPKYSKGIPYSAQRLNSVLDLKRPEARIFNYDLDLEFVRKIRVPMFAVFGSREEYAIIKPKEMLEKIKSAARAPCETLLVNGANHSFKGKEKKVSDAVVNWVKKFA